MNMRALVTAFSLSIMLGLGVLVGSLMVQTAAASPSAVLGSVAAQASPTAQAQTTPGANKTPGTSGTAGAHGDRGGASGRGGHGPGGAGGFGGGIDGGRGGINATVDGATRAISATNEIIALVKADIAYAAGKTDTATAQSWLDGATSLVAKASSASTAGQYGQAVGTAGAARELASAADLLLQQALGASTLPSYTNRALGGRGPHGDTTTATTVTQAQASRQLAAFYNEIVSRDALLKASGVTGDAATYLAAAKSSYSTAYTAYGAGNYSAASNAAQVGERLLRVVASLQSAASAPTGTDAPVTVPAPNF